MATAVKDKAVARKPGKTRANGRLKKPSRQSAASRRKVDRTPPRASPTTAERKLPGWAELSGKRSAPARRKRAVSGSMMDAISTRKFILVVLAIAGAFTAWVGHVHATQDLLAAVQQERKINHNLNLKYNRLKGEFDRMTGPSTIYSRAHEMGLREDVSFGPAIRVE